MDRIALKAEERTIFGKKVKQLRRNGFLPGNVYGNTKENEAVSVELGDFLKVFTSSGETGLIDLKIGSEKVRPVLIRDIQYDPIKSSPLHVDFYQVNLSQKVQVAVPIHLIGEEPELVHAQEAVVLQVLNEVQVEALPTDLVEDIKVDITKLQKVDDALTVGQLDYDRSKLTILADAGEVVVKLAPAVTAEMEALLAEQEAEAQAAQEAAAAAEEVPEAEGEAPAEAIAEEGAEVPVAGKEEKVSGEEGTKTETATTKDNEVTSDQTEP